MPSEFLFEKAYVDTPPSKKFQKEGLHFNRQKFQKDERVLEQLLLSEGKVMEAVDLQHQIEITGLNFSAAQLRAVAGLYFLLDRTNFQGNALAEPEGEYTASHFRGSLPRLRFTYPEYLMAYGIKRKRDGGLDCNETNAALEALKSLTQPFRIVYRKLAGYENGEAKHHVVVVEQGLISVLSDYGILRKQASAAVIHQDQYAKVRHITISFSPLWVDGITSYYLRRPVSLYQEIRDFHKGRRFSESVYLLADYLLTLDHSPMRVHVKTLERRLWLDRHRKQGQPERIRKALDDALRTAQHVGLLGGYRYDSLGAIILDLNPERCKLVAKRLRSVTDSQPRSTDELQPGPFN